MGVRLRFVIEKAVNYPPLPQSVYDDFADDGVSVITMPAGSWYVAGDVPLLLRRSNVTINCAGCVLYVNPADVDGGHYPFSVQSVTDVSATYTPNPSSGPVRRHISHLSGTVTTGTTTLTMDAGEVVDLDVGETVLLWLGVTPSDPHEAQAFVPAVVASVNPGTRVVTFEDPLGVNVVDYVNAAGLLAVVAEGQEYKIADWGAWPVDGNFSKGYGTDHGMERFVGGGMVHDVTINDPTIRLDRAESLALAPSGMWDIAAVGVQRFTLNNLLVHNPHGSVIHLWRCFDAVVDGVTITGRGAAKIFDTQIATAYALSVWGGDGLAFSDVTITATDTVLFAVEIEATGITLDGCVYNVAFTTTRTLTDQPTVLGLFSIGDIAVINDLSMTATLVGGASPLYLPFSPIEFTGSLVIGGSSLIDFFSFGTGDYNKTLSGTVTINGVTYGPAITETLDYTITHGASFRDVVVPAGLYTSSTLKLVANGDIRDVLDAWDHGYWPALEDGSIETLSQAQWQQIAPGAFELNKYLTKYVRFYLNNAGSTDDGTARFQVTYLPEV